MIHDACLLSVVTVVCSCEMILLRLFVRPLCAGRQNVATSHLLQLSRRGFKRHKLVKDVTSNVMPKVQAESANVYNKGKVLMKCSTFTVAFCTATFTGVSIWEYERIRKAKSEPLLHWTKLKWNSLEGYENKGGDWRKSLNRWWNDLSEGHKVFWPICFLNAIVYAGWQVPALQATFLRYFAFSPAARAVCWPMLLSSFSHYNLFHFGANMYVLHSFSAPVCDKLGPEQFVGLYLGCGVVSAFAGGVFKMLIHCPKPSLGASGAIMGLLGYFCSTYPDARLGIVFIPQFHFSAEQGLTALLCLDTVGLILRWSLFDHACHLGGALSGMAYARWGQQLWLKHNFVMQQWHRLRLYLAGAER